MLDSAPVPLQAVLWPLVGSAIILFVGRFLPNWLRRLVALGAALASLAVLWSLTSQTVRRVEYFWEPLSLFRMSPILYPDGLALLAGVTLAGFTAATALGIRGAEPRRTAWHGLILAALAGCLVMTMASNLLTLTLGSALIDFALVGIAVSAASDVAGTDRSAWRIAVPGILSTLVLFLGTLRMDTQLGTASLLARQVSAEALVLVGAASLLRMVIFPLHPRGLRTPEIAATLILPLGVGVYLLARVQALAPILSDQPWLFVLGGVALLAGGLMVWSGGFGSATRRGAREGTSGQPEGEPSGDLGTEQPHASNVPAEWAARATGALRPKRSSQPESSGEFGDRCRASWLGIAVHQTGYAVAFVTLLGAPVPWPLVSLTLALGALIIWWDDSLDREAHRWSVRASWLGQGLETQWAKARSYVATRVPALRRLGESLLWRSGSALIPAVAVASLVGIPFTVGAVGRWPFYASLLSEGRAALLLAILVADTFLVAGLWAVMRAAVREAGRLRPSLGALLPMIALAVSVVILGIAPGMLTGRLDVPRSELPDVSVWGLGLIYLLPWLLGTWLAHISSNLADYLNPVWRVVSLDWVFRAGTWVSLRLVGAIYWVGRVGEGEGWWGWALIVLALGAMLLTVR